MTGKEFKEILDRLSEQELESLRIMVHIKENTLGPTPAVDIESASIGFDWNKGRLILEPVVDLKKVV